MLNYLKYAIASILFLSYPITPLLANAASPSSHLQTKAKLKTHIPVKTKAQLGSNPEVPSINNHLLLRGYTSLSHEVYVDPFSGKLVIHIPLVKFPLNDGLTFQVTVTDLLRNSSEVYAEPKGIGPIRYSSIPNAGSLGYSFELTPGITSFSPPALFGRPDLEFLFLDPTGNMHLFVMGPKSQPQDYYTHDNWKATITGRQGNCHGTIYRPDGVRYTVAPIEGSICAVTTITSAHGGSSISYKYGGAGIQSITASNGYSIVFHYSPFTLTYPAGVKKIPSLISSMASSDNRNWQFAYRSSGLSILGPATPVLKQITLPNKKTWALSPGPSGFVENIVTPNHLKINTNTGKQVVGLWTPFGVIVEPRTNIYFSGPNVTTLPLSYSYNINADPNITKMTGPGIRKIYTYRHNDIDNNLLPGWFNGLPVNIKIYDLNQPGGPLVKSISYGWGPRNTLSTVFALPELQAKTITQDGVSYKTVYSDFDAYGYPQTTVVSSPAGTITTKTTYYINTNTWIFKPENTTVYDAEGNIINQINRTYNSAGEMLSKSVNGVKTTYTYDSNGDITSITNALGLSSTYKNYVTGFAEQQTDPMGNLRQYTLDNDGEITSFTDPMGHKTTYQYDNMLRPITITPPLHNATTIAWDTLSPGSEIITRGNLQTTILKNAYGNIINTIKKDTTTGTSIAVSRHYDAFGRLTYQSYPNSALGISKTYDALGRLLTIRQPSHWQSGVTDLSFDPIHSAINWLDPVGARSYNIIVNGQMVASGLSGSTTTYALPSLVHGIPYHITVQAIYSNTLPENTTINVTYNGFPNVSAPLNFTYDNKTETVSWQAPLKGKVDYYTFVFGEPPKPPTGNLKINGNETSFPALSNTSERYQLAFYMHAEYIQCKQEKISGCYVQLIAHGVLGHTAVSNRYTNLPSNEPPPHPHLKGASR